MSLKRNLGDEGDRDREILKLLVDITSVIEPRCNYKVQVRGDRDQLINRLIDQYGTLISTPYNSSTKPN